MMLLAILATAASQDIPNWNFESWTGNNPDDWDSSNDDLALFGIFNVSPETEDPHEGSSSLKAYTAATAFFTLSGIACNGYYEGPNPVNNETETIKGVPFTGSPTTLSLWYKYTGMENDSSFMAIHLFKEGQLIAKGEHVDTASVEEWTQLDIPISWNSEVEPDTMLILVKSSYGTTAANGGAVANSTIWVDELQLIYPVSTEEIKEEQLSIYPNPFSQEIRLQLPSGQQALVRIYAVSGAKVLEESISGSQSISTGHLERGIYLIEVTRGEERMVKKLFRH